MSIEPMCPECRIIADKQDRVYWPKSDGVITHMAWGNTETSVIACQYQEPKLEKPLMLTYDGCFHIRGMNRGIVLDDVGENGQYLDDWLAGKLGTLFSMASGWKGYALINITLSDGQDG